MHWFTILCRPKSARLSHCFRITLRGKDGGLPAKAIGRIDLLPRITAVAIQTEYARQALLYLQQGRVKKMRVRARLLN